MQGDELLRHAEDDLLDEPEVAVLDVGELHLLQEFLAQAASSGVRRAAETAAPRSRATCSRSQSRAFLELLAQASFGNARTLAGVADFAA